jgi:hypothetical protein
MIIKQRIKCDIEQDYELTEEEFKEVCPNVDERIIELTDEFEKFIRKEFDENLKFNNLEITIEEVEP